MRSIWALAAFFLLGGLGPAQRTASCETDADCIVARALSTSIAVIEAGDDLRYTYLEHQERRKLDGEGNLKDLTTKLYRVEPRRGRIYTRFLERNGEPISGKDLQKELARQQEFDQQSSRSDVELFDSSRFSRARA